MSARQRPERPEWMQVLLESTNANPNTCLAIAQKRLPTAIAAVVTGLDETGFDLRCTYRLPEAKDGSARAASRSATTGLQKFRVLFPQPMRTASEMRAAIEAIVSAATAAAPAAAPAAPSAADTAASLSRADSPAAVAAAAVVKAAPAPTASPAASPPVSGRGADSAPLPPPQRDGIPFIRTPLWPMPIVIALGMAVLWLVAYRPPGADVATAAAAGDVVARAYTTLHALGLLMCRTQNGLHYLFVAACGAHVLEASVAWSKAAAAGCSRTATALWVLQTLAWGYPSLGLLNAAIAERAAAAVVSDSPKPKAN